ncbi:hypothetical protein FA13DRAFT_1736962 [Coprinellus micaceus]|uniref:Uncharacterized protein n=1 Tax=Coprinellus micaceus TaxID=71717 RepID=A0A4Y7SYL0_COPMI|nr:hypothetical protein FA13DRAFT_1736962 [Coprinellus micaceus]
MSNPIYQPSPRYQGQFPVNAWTGDETSSQPFFSPLPTSRYTSGVWERPPDLSGAGSFKDSGYGSSQTRSKIEGQDPFQRVPPLLLETPESSTSATLLGDEDEQEEEEEDGFVRKPQRYAAELGRRPTIYIPPEIASPELVYPMPGENYITMRPHTPPASSTSFKSYKRRFKAFVDHLKSLKWVEKERCTADYYPGTGSHTARHLQHRPMIIWHARDYYGGNSGEFYEDSSADGESARFVHQLHPGHASDLNLLDEFEGPEYGHERSSYPQYATYSPNTQPDQVDLTREFSEARPRRRRTAQRYPGGYVRYADLPVRSR